MIEDLDISLHQNILSWLPHGRSFIIKDSEAFESEVLPRFFSRQKNFSSFTRQLSLYGFLRATAGHDRGSYYHPLFLKGRRNLVMYMRRVGLPNGKEDRRRIQQQEGPDPDFYSMPTMEVY
jgi:hypothetical protein